MIFKDFVIGVEMKRIEALLCCLSSEFDVLVSCRVSDVLDFRKYAC